MAKEKNPDRLGRLKQETKKSILGLLLVGLGVILTLAGFSQAGPLGDALFGGLSRLFGLGYAVLPVSLFLVGGAFLFSRERGFVWLSLMGGGLFILAVLGVVDIVLPSRGGMLGLALGSLRGPFGAPTAFIANLLIATIALLIALDIPLVLRWPLTKKEKAETDEMDEEEEPQEEPQETPEEQSEEKQEKEESFVVEEKAGTFLSPRKILVRKFKNYTPPPLSLLSSAIDKPTTGDLRANANIIKRTLESFGIAVEMGEINIGPKVTRYTLKPAEGVKLSRIIALGQDLALALAAHPIRIEAPIPGKSLVGVEVPNKAAALVRLGSLMGYEDFQKSGPLSFALGRDVTGEPIFPDIQKMPHLLIAGATGSGKSIALHTLLISLLYKNSPEMLKLIMIDPKRVELSVYEGIPHLITPVITENKKAVGVFRWALKEMDRRYELLRSHGSRDIKGYHATEDDRERLPYLLIVIDELADLMTSYGREVEGSIVRLAQMARATGIHLILSTQRPSVEIITGLIKANITTRIALQVASQIDSRTILDTGGAEKLLGGGDLLFISSELSKPKRLQGAYANEGEITAVADFIRDNNPMELSEAPELAEGEMESGMRPIFDEENGGESDDELYQEALDVVKEAGKASASLLQRRLKVGYARAARLLDLMEEAGAIGPGDGAKPREVYMEKEEI